MILNHPAAALLSPEWHGTVRGPAVLAVGIASAVATTYAAYRQSEAEQASAKFNQQVQSQNAQIAGVQARSIQEQGVVQEDAYRRRLAALMGTQRAGLAATGVDPNTGSALDLQSDTAALGALDVAQMRQQTRNSVWQARLQGAGATNQAQLYGYQASQTSPALAGGVSLLGGATTVGRDWYQFYGRTPSVPVR